MREASDERLSSLAAEWFESRLRAKEVGSDLAEADAGLAC